MFPMQFHVTRRSRDSHWVVILWNSVYGAYLDKEQAVLDAIDVARDAVQAGHQAQVWIRDRSASVRVF